MTLRLAKDLKKAMGAGLLVAFTMGLLLPTQSFGKNVGAKVLPISPLKKAAFLNFPIFPKEIQDKITGATALTKPKAVPTTKYDSSLSRDWPLTNIGFFEVFTPLLQPVKSTTELCSKGITVAVVDTGIDYTHPELKDNVWINKGETGPWEPPPALAALTSCRDKSCNGIDDDGNGFTDDVVGWDFVNEVPLPYDVHGHGTHIAGIISSQPGSGVGFVGVCPKVTIMPLKYYDNSGLGYNNLQNTVRAIQYAVKMGADIINYSGGGADPAPSERAAIEAAQKAGILFVAAAGNDGHNNDQVPYYPANYGLENIISVASVNKDNQLLPSSNYGRTVHVGAPGLGILSTLPGGKYGTMSGTSQATAFVTGAAALLASQWKTKAEFDFRKLKNWVIEGAKPFPSPDKQIRLSAGLLSVPKSLEAQRIDFKRATPPVELAVRPDKKAKN